MLAQQHKGSLKHELKHEDDILNVLAIGQFLFGCWGAEGSRQSAQRQVTSAQNKAQLSAKCITEL
jgi:hypothetical protein